MAELELASRWATAVGCTAGAPYGSCLVGLSESGLPQQGTREEVRGQGNRRHEGTRVEPGPETAHHPERKQPMELAARPRARPTASTTRDHQPQAPGLL